MVHKKLSKYRSVFITGIVSCNVCGFVIVLLAIVQESYSMQTLIFAFGAFSLSILCIFFLAFTDSSKFKWAFRPMDDLR